MTVTFIEALRQALDEEMLADPAVHILGEDVALGGPFGVTRGLAETHGISRVRNTPISEAAIAGAAVGAALVGLRPVLEIMFMDFVTLALDAIVNQAAKYRYMSGGQLSVPLVIRTASGAAGGAGAQHSQSLEAWLVHVPGLVVVAPSTPSEAYGLLKAAIRTDDPVVFIEHKRLYGSRELITSKEIRAIDRGRVVRQGSDVTLITYSRMVGTAMDVAESRAKQGTSVEVIDLRCLQPLDMELILKSLAKTHRALIVHEGVASSGLGAEIAARLAHEGFDELDAPILRVGSDFAPIPFSPRLEKAVLPSVESIELAIDELFP